MRIGVTGHQKRDGIDWAWVRGEIAAEFKKLSNIEAAYSSLAAGTDQVFAEVALESGISVFAVLPLKNYERFFEGDDLRRFEAILRRSKPIDLDIREEPEIAFLKAGRFIVDHVDLLIAVWDGQPSQGIGGTADIVDYASSRCLPTFRIDPIVRNVGELNARLNIPPDDRDG